MYDKTAMIIQYSGGKQKWQEIEEYLQTKIHRFVYIIHLSPEEIVKMKIRKKSFQELPVGEYEEKVEKFMNYIYTFMDNNHTPEEYRKQTKHVKKDLLDGITDSLKTLIKDLTGLDAVDIHTSFNTENSELVIVFSLAKNLENSF